jgi:hypothetical protein
MTMPPGTAVRYNPPPNWPAPPPGWTPPPGWSPDPAWGPPPEGWQLWVADTTAPAPAWGAATATAPVTPWYRRVPKWAYAAIGTAVIGIIVADAVPGTAGHVIALVVWIAAGVLCLRPAISKAKSSARIGARAGVAVCACFAIYAGALAATSAASSGNNFCFVNTEDEMTAETGVLAIPQSGATQGKCDAVAQQFQSDVLNDAGPDGDYVNALVGTHLAVDSDRPGYLSASQQYNDEAVFGIPDGLKNWFVVSGTVAGIPALKGK